LTLSLPDFRRFCARLSIPSRDEGVIPFTRMYGTQDYLLQELAAGLEAGVHEYVVLKGGRQIGGTTIGESLSIYWLQTYPGMVGCYTFDDDENRDFHRDVLLQMLDSLPRAYRWPTRVNNQGHLAWSAPNRSRLIFAAAGKRFNLKSNLGRSRGLNFRIDDEIGAWNNEKAISSLNAAFSKRHPHRFRMSISTAQGAGPFRDMWRTAQTAVSQRAIFVAWWRREDFRIDPSETAMWDRYGEEPPSSEEREWMDAVAERYEVVITQEQVAWYRWTLAEEFFGDTAMMDQEYGSLPEQCFVAFGDRIIGRETIKRLQRDLAKAPNPATYRCDFGTSLDTMRLDLNPEGQLRIWEQPDPQGVYVVSAHPARSSDPDAASFVCQVWRAWADELIQVAEYASYEGSMYQFAWLAMNLAAAYRFRVPAFFALEVGTVGKYVLAEIQRIQNYGYGLSPSAVNNRDVRNVIGNIQHFQYVRPDQATVRSAPLGWKMSAEIRPWIIHQLRDEIERGHVVIRSPELIDGLDGLRRGEEGDADVIEAGGVSDDSRVVTASYAVEHWLRNALPTVHVLAGQKRPDRWAPKTVEGRLVGNYLQGVMQKGRPRSA